MYCENCGTKLDPQTNCCPNCGAVCEHENKKTALAAPEQFNLKFEKGAVLSKLKAAGKKVYVAAGIVLLLIVVCVIAVTSGRKTIDLSDYVTIEFSGYNGRGIADLSFDQDALLEDFSKKASDKNVAQWSSLFGDLAYYSVFDYIDCEVTPYEFLSNGDKAELQWDVDSESIKDLFGVKVVAKDKRMTVEGLEDIVYVDFFEKLDVTFSGVSPDGTMSMEINDEEFAPFESFRFEAQTNGLENGDTVVIELVPFGYEYLSYADAETFCLEKYGVIPEEMQKEYVVEGLGAFVTSGEQLTEEFLNAMDAQSKDVLTSLTATWQEVVTLLETDYLGYYLLLSKNGGGNYIYNVYKATAEFAYDGQSEIVEYITCVCYENVSINEDGECSADLLNYYTPNNSHYIESSVMRNGQAMYGYFPGFGSLHEMQKVCIDGILGQYSYETTIPQV